MAEMIDHRSGEHEQSETNRDRQERCANVAPANTSDMEEVQGASIYAKRNRAQRQDEGEWKNDVASRPRAESPAEHRPPVDEGTAQRECYAERTGDGFAQMHW
jgi:hypothetical protein